MYKKYFFISIIFSVDNVQDEIWFSDVDVDQESLIEDIVINDEIYEDLFNNCNEVSIHLHINLINNFLLITCIHFYI